MVLIHVWWSLFWTMWFSPSPSYRMAGSVLHYVSLCVCVCLTLFSMLYPAQRRMRRMRSVTLAEERDSSSRTCEKEYSLGTNYLRMWRKGLSLTSPVMPHIHFLPLHTMHNTCHQCFARLSWNGERYNLFQINCVIFHENSKKVSNMSVAPVVFEWVPKTLVVILGDYRNMKTHIIFNKNAMLWHFVCSIQNGKYHLCSSTDVQMTGQYVRRGFGQYLWWVGKLRKLWNRPYTLGIGM